ncbi:nitroreductase family protein [Nitrospirota bacterium]
MELLSGLYSRRSIRHFTPSPVNLDHIEEIIKAGSWAPSGLNNQPWRFVPVSNKDILNNLALLTKYHRIIKEAPLSIAVFIHKDSMYNEVKDHQAMGACIQNMLLAAHALGLGAVWMGEILNRAEEARALLGLTNEFELMAVVAVGHPTGEIKESKRKPLNEVILKSLD